MNTATKLNYANLTQQLTEVLTKPQPAAEGSQTTVAKILPGTAPIFEKSKIDPTVANNTTRWRVRLLGVGNNASVTKVLEAAKKLAENSELSETHSVNVTAENTSAKYKGEPMRTFVLAFVWTPIENAAATTTAAATETAATAAAAPAAPAAKPITVSVSGKFTATASGTEGQTLRDVLSAANVKDFNSFSYRSGNQAISLDRKLTGSISVAASTRSAGG